MENIERRFQRLESLITCTQKNVLNIDEVCTLTGLSKSTIYKLTMNGGIPHYKQVKHLYFDRVEIENWLKQEPSSFNSNAKLIAAAPDMLDALILFTNNIDNWLETGIPADAETSKQIYEMAKQAIKKATE